MDLTESDCTKKVCKAEKRREEEAAAAHTPVQSLSLLRPQAAPSQKPISQGRSRSNRKAPKTCTVCTQREVLNTCNRTQDLFVMI